jgi:glycosyltransferase involved in cell wall biosynthesis
MAQISVVVPAFNAEAYIRETIESVLAQTFADLEVVVVDDGSTDATCAIVGEYGSVRLIRQQQGGAAKARNAGVAAATGEWIAFLDADDLWTPEKLAEQVELARQGAAPFLFSDRLNIGDRGPLPEVQSTIQPLLEGDIFEALLHGNFITTSSVLVRREVFQGAGGFCEDPILPPAEDWELWTRVTHDHRAIACRIPHVKYRNHLTGASRNVTRMNTARLSVVRRALALPRGRAMSATSRRRIWGDTWATNGWDAARHGHHVEAFRCYAKSLLARPSRGESYVGIARLLSGRS